MYIYISVDVGLYKWGTSIFVSSSVPHIGLDIICFKHDFQQWHELSLVFFKISVTKPHWAVQKRPLKTEDGKLWWNFGVVKGLERHRVSKTAPCRDNTMLSLLENCPLCRIPPASNQTLTLLVNNSSSSWHCGQTAAWRPADLLSLSEATLYLREFSFTFPLSAAARLMAAGHARVCVRVQACVYSRISTPQEQLFLGYLDPWVNLLATTSTIWQLLALPLTAVWGKRIFALLSGGKLCPAFASRKPSVNTQCGSLCLIIRMKLAA